LPARSGKYVIFQEIPVTQCQGNYNRVAIGQEMVREKIPYGQAKVRKFYFESRKIDI